MFSSIWWKDVDYKIDSRFKNESQNFQMIEWKKHLPPKTIYRTIIKKQLFFRRNKLWHN